MASCEDVLQNNIVANVKNMACFGALSCRLATITRVKTIYAAGYYSLHESNIISGGIG